MKTSVRLLGLLSPFRWWIALAVLLSFATVGSSVGLMAVSAYLISKAALVTSVTDLSLAITGVRFFAIARAGFRYAERYVTHTATFHILTRLRVWLYAAIEPLAPARLTHYRSGDLLTRIVADIETLENFYVRVVVPPLAAALVTALACAILGAFDWTLALALLIFLLLTGVALPLTSRWLSQQPARAVTTVRAELNMQVLDTVQGMGDLLVSGTPSAHQAQAQYLSDELNRLQERLAIVRGLGDGLSALFISLAGITVLWLATPLVTGGQIDGVMLALLPLTAIASFEAVQPLSQAFQYLEAGQASARRLFEIIDTPPPVVDPSQPAPAPEYYDIEVENLQFAYSEKEMPVLQNLNFTAGAGQRVAIVGASGAGKTTLVNLLLRFWEYDQGHIRIGGRELREFRGDDVRTWIAVVAQDTYLFNTTLRDNLLLARTNANCAELNEACRRAQLHEFIAALPDGYDTMVGEHGVQLSGGERQRLAIARALLKQAPILILDEATVHLDSLTEQDVVAALKEAMVGRTTLIIAHRLSDTFGVTQIVALNSDQSPPEKKTV